MHNDLERSLRALAGYVEFPPDADLSTGVISALNAAERPRRSWWSRPAFTVASLLVLATAGTLVLSAPAREAVADFLGIGGVRIEFTEPNDTRPTPLEPGGDLDLGRPTTLAAARDHLPIGIPAMLGQPDAVFLDELTEERVSLVYAPRPGIPESEETGVGALLTQFRSTLDQGLFKKLLDQGVELRFVSVNGMPAYWVEGEHELLLLDEEGNVVPDTARLAGNTLIWEVGGITLRLEADISLTRALEIAESVG